MKKESKRFEWLKNAESTVSIPDADQAWREMHALLEEDLPETVIPVSQTATINRGRTVLIVLLVLMISSPWLYTRYEGKPEIKKTRMQNGSGALPGSKNNSMVNSPVAQNRPDFRIIFAKKLRKAGVSQAGSPQEKGIDQYVPGFLQNPPEANKIYAHADSVSRTKGKKDSVASEASDTNEEATIKMDDYLLLQAGMQWTGQIPTGNSGFYFSGPNGRSEPYRLLLPGIWIQLMVDKSLFHIEFNPFVSSLVPSKPFLQQSSKSIVRDTSYLTNETKTLNKIFGVSAALGFEHRFTGNWWAGGGIQSNFWQNGIATLKKSVIKQTGSNPTTLSDIQSSNIYQLSDSERVNFSNFQLNLFSELVYRKGYFQGGLRLSLPIMPLSIHAGPSYSLKADLFFRLVLFQRRLKQ